MRINLDTFLVTHIDSLVKDISVKDRRILISLSKQLRSGVFITENQANLILKIFQENSISYPSDYTWSTPFRRISQVRKIFLHKDSDVKSIVVEFTFNKRLKAILAEVLKKIDGNVVTTSKQYSFLLTENNIFQLLTAFGSERFDIDPIIQSWFDEIVEIKSESTQPYLIENVPERIKEIISLETGNNEWLIVDRQHRYQYKVSTATAPNNLIQKLASRNDTKVFVNSKTSTLVELIHALKTLKRFPVLVVFNPHDAKESYEQLVALNTAIQIVDPESTTGIYFRFESSTDANGLFNSYIKEQKLNSFLTLDTSFVGISNNQLPKFMLSNPWYPKTVISFVNNFKSNKTSVFCDQVDLIIYYNKTAPIGIVDEIV